MYDGANQRRYERLNADLAVYIEVAATAGEEGTILRTETIDVSSRGFRVWCPKDLPVDSILQLAAEMPGSDEVLVLAGQIRWTRPADYNDGHWIGFELFNATDSDIEKWETLVGELQRQAG